MIAITGLQFDSEEDEPVEVISAGKYYQKGNKHFILYDEYLSENNFGYGESIPAGATCADLTKNTIVLTDGIVEIIKSGANNVHMVFETGKKNVTSYHTPFGELIISTHTAKIELQESENEIIVNLTYGLDMNYSYISDCRIVIKILANV
jgi:uncharacterized beta-barrel protein YwiB (DUF1934 family)